MNSRVSTVAKAAAAAAATATLSREYGGSCRASAVVEAAELPADEEGCETAEVVAVTAAADAADAADAAAISDAESNCCPTDPVSYSTREKKRQNNIAG